MVGGRVMERICELCVRNLLSNKATMFCSACSESLCDRCISIHIKDTSKKHVIMDVRYKGLDSHGVDMNGLDMCNKHSKIIEFYCECHKELCCSKCVMVHRKCDNFIEIVVCTEQDRIQIRDVKASVLKADVDTFFLVQKVNQVKASLKETNEAMSKAIDTTRDNILKVYDDAKCKLFAEVDAIKAEKMKTLKKMNNILLSVRADIAKALPVFSNVLEKGTHQQIFIFSRRSTEILNAVDKQLRLNPNLNPLPEMHVNFAGDIANLIHAGDNLMKLNIGKEVIDKGQPEINNSSMQNRPVTLQLLKSVDVVKSKDDNNDPFVTGLDFLPDGRLVAADNRNNKCFIMNERLQRKGQPYNFKTAVLDVRCVFHFLIAVSTGKQICIMYINSECSISLIKRINTSSSIFSISCMTSSKMVVSTYNDNRSVRMISYDGVEEDFDKFELPKTIYKIDESRCTYIQAKNTLVITDKLAHSVYMYDTLKGTSRAVTDESIQQPSGVCVGPGDTVLVCSKMKCCIVHLSVEGDILGTYPVDMKWPYVLCLNKDGSKLVVSNNVNGINKLLIYKLS
ncbi:hypothetical protein DPMN_082169 [Dreissena polymorpha]|uniref:B box-type domain-containing protein n=2 Tax=Dreissena polymorpha TaxID=45954 RepID=A0A9D3Y6G9_DREPO|nr:hypothetical protein DPMN_082169 [Dreissena polymorpha]